MLQIVENGMAMMVLLAIVTLAYVGYNLLIKVSGDHMPPEATTTVLAAFCLQFGALISSTVFLAFLGVQGGHTFRLTVPSYLFALAAGLCIGVAEICYFYLFSGPKALPASVVIPTVVAGTVVITLAASYVVFRESITLLQLAGAVLIAGGIVVMFAGRRAVA